MVISLNVQCRSVACYIRATMVTNCTKKKLKKNNHTATYLVAATFYLHDIVPSGTNVSFKSVERQIGQSMVFKLHFFENRYKKCFALV